MAVSKLSFDKQQQTNVTNVGNLCSKNQQIQSMHLYPSIEMHHSCSIGGLQAKVEASETHWVSQGCYINLSIIIQVD